MLRVSNPSVDGPKESKCLPGNAKVTLVVVDPKDVLKLICFAFQLRGPLSGH
jgi:hypothetical protein